MEVYFDPDEQPRYPVSDKEYLIMIIVFFGVAAALVVGFVIFCATLASYLDGLIWG